jgi:hypothetical protein
MRNQIQKLQAETNNESRAMQALNRCLDALIGAVTIISIQAGAAIRQSPDVGEHLFKATLLPELPVMEEETQIASSGASYVSKRVYEDAYLRITVYFNEYGIEVKRDSKKL